MKRNYTYQSTDASGALTFSIVSSGWGGAGWKGYVTSVGTATKDIKERPENFFSNILWAGTQSRRSFHHHFGFAIDPDRETTSP